MDFKLKEGERLDDLVRDGMRVIQRPDQFCFSLDSVLLAHFVKIKKHDRIIDLGTGTAVIPLLLSAFGAEDITAVEKNPTMADLARRNVLGNGKGESIRVAECDYRGVSEIFLPGGFTSVVANPPYREVGRGALSGKSGVADARHELTATLADVFGAARHLLSFGGRLTMVHRADRLADLIEEGRCRCMEIKRLRFVQSHRGEEASRVLAEWKYGGNPGVKIFPPLIVHEEDGGYTREILEIYGKE